MPAMFRGSSFIGLRILFYRRLVELGSWSVSRSMHKHTKRLFAEWDSNPRYQYSRGKRLFFYLQLWHWRVYIECTVYFLCCSWLLVKGVWPWRKCSNKVTFFCINADCVTVEPYICYTHKHKHKYVCMKHFSRWGCADTARASFTSISRGLWEQCRCLECPPSFWWSNPPPRSNI